MGGEISRSEAFKRATASAVRAIAGSDEVEIAYQPGAASLNGKRARLPAPTRALPPAEMARLRGVADAIALRLKHHDDAVHAGHAPLAGEARDVYDALEQARVEIHGAEHMAGVAANLRHKLELESEAEGLDRMVRAEQLPRAQALALLARERMDDASVPEAARHILDLWRETLPEAAEQALDDLATSRASQDDFARAARRLLTALDLAEAEADSEEGEESEESGEAGEQSLSQDNAGEGEGEAQVDDQQLLAESPQTSESESSDTTPEEEIEDEGADAADEAPAGPQQRRRPTGEDVETHYHAFTRAFDEEVDADELCDPEELERLRQQLDQQLQHMQGVVSRLANRLQRRLLARQQRAWDFDLEEGLLDVGRLARVVADPLEVPDDLDRRADDPEVARDRLLQRDDLEAARLDVDLHRVDVVVAVVADRDDGTGLHEAVAAPLPLDDHRGGEHRLQLADPRLHLALGVLGGVVVAVLREIAEGAGRFDVPGDLDPSARRQVLELGDEARVGLRRELRLAHP